MTTESSPPTNDITTAENKPIDELVRRARSLYSLPAVAAEVIQLTNNPKVDARALKECIQTDPALTAKILRVVNSSLFGLSREVSDLNQALALLGTKPLKLLVLGFSLPESLFSEVAREQLDWYWLTTLTRAVAAREISEQLFNRPGDDAFLAGLFQDIGILVLLGELKEPYAKLLSGVIEHRVDLQQLEADSLGFDHLQLTAGLLEHWKMPKVLVRAISEPRVSTQIVRCDEDHAELTKVVHLAELVAELVGQNRLGVLPDLLEVGGAYCELDKERLNKLVETLQPKVEQLAEVLSLELSTENGSATDYVEILTTAHQQMSQLTEEVVELLGHAPLVEEEAYSNLLADATHLRSVVDSFLHCTSPPTSGSAAITTAVQQVSTPATPNVSKASNARVDATADFMTQLTLMTGHCRSRRQSVSLVMLEVSGPSCNNAKERSLLAHVLEMELRTVEVTDMIREAISPCRHVLVLPGFDRQEAVRLTGEIIAGVDKMVLRLEEKGTFLKYITSAGVSSVLLPPKNFPPQDLLDTAERCLSAAQSSDTSVVKSLESY